ncbi:MAG: ATP-binding protein [Paludibacteraceae bacterium]|nr:ATP-binding protein [Paludibacteraceae bacterium]
MDGFKNIEIRNFRGIDYLKIDDFSRVNVFLGQNSSGKSSVLECLLLMMGMSNSDLPQNINSIRSRNFSSFADLTYMFHGLDLKVKPEMFSELFDNSKRHLSLDLTYVFDGKSQADLQNGQIPTSETKAFLNTLRMLFDVESGQQRKTYECSVTVTSQGFISNKKPAEGYLEKNSAAFLPADLAAGNPANDLVELAKRRLKDVVTERLKSFDSRITTLEILNNVAYVGLEGIDQLLAVNMQGDGLRRYLNIVAASANPTNNILLIDEIDNGLHYSAYKKLWEAIFALATSTNKQVFVTTHSKETLKRLNEMLEEHPEYQQEMRLYTIEKTKLKGHQAYKLTYNGLHEACLNEIEIRSIVL